MMPKNLADAWRLCLLLSLLLAGAAGCRQNSADQPPNPLPPTATSVATAATATPSALAEHFVTVATSAPYPPFVYFDEFGSVVGFDADVLDALMQQTGHEYEFVVTNFDGLLDSVANGEFDMAVSPLITPEPRPGLAYTTPYLEIGQVLVVLANENDIQSYNDLQPGLLVGVVADSFGQKTALETVRVAETDLKYYGSVEENLQALIDGAVRGVIIDHDDATQFTDTYFQQLKIVGGPGREAWITSRTQVMAVNANQPELLAALNGAIAQLNEDGTAERLVRNWLVSKATLDAGESLVGTPDDVLVIGVIGQTGSIDPADQPDIIGWEIKRNTMSGLVMFDADNNLVPILAADFPVISADKLEYTFELRPGLAFPDGTPLTADDVKWSIDRAASGGNWHVNAFLKDSDENSLADFDAVQVLSPTSVKITLKAPTAYFLSALATPAYYVASQNCYATSDTPAQTCSGIGPYEIIEWEQGLRLQLKANPQWPADLPRPGIANVQLRFYDNADDMRSALAIEAIDMAWTGLRDSDTRDLQATPGLQLWSGPSTFKSYIVFEQSQPPWDNPTVRLAAAYAIDREALANEIFAGRRQPLYSPVPDNVPGHLPAEPARDLDQARELLGFLGYNENTPLEITLWYLNDGRYTPLEEAYARAIKAQLEETGVFEVTLEGAPWEVYSGQMSACEYPTFLLGWPPVGWPTRLPSAMGWMEYFITNTEQLCSNYQSPAMEALVAELRSLDPLDFAAQEAVYVRMQELWATEFPTLDLTQAAPQALAWGRINGIRFDNMGLLHYELLTKTPGE